MYGITPAWLKYNFLLGAIVKSFAINVFALKEIWLSLKEIIFASPDEVSLLNRNSKIPSGLATYFILNGGVLGEDGDWIWTSFFRIISL